MQYNDVLYWEEKNIGVIFVKSTTRKRIFMFLKLYVFGLIGGFIAQYFKYSNIEDIDFYSVILIPLGVSIGILSQEKAFKRNREKKKR